MTDNRQAWQAMLEMAQQNQERYATIIVALDLLLAQVEAAIAPQGEATDHITNTGVAMQRVSESKTTKDVMAILRMIGNDDHRKAINHIRQARNQMSRAITHSMQVVTRIQRAVDDLGGI